MINYYQGKVDFYTQQVALAKENGKEKAEAKHQVELDNYTEALKAQTLKEGA